MTTVGRNIARSAACIAALLALDVTGAPIVAAQSLGSGTASLEGTVRDSAGRSAQRTSVCAMIWQSRAMTRSVCGQADSIGAFRVDSLPASQLRVTVSCAGLRPFAGKLLASDSIEFAPGARVRRDWVVSRAGCDSRPIRRVTGVFRGHFTPGFESSKFVPCPADAWFAPGDSLESYVYDAHMAWARFQPGVARQRLEWPAVVRDRYGNPRFYVRWRGTVVGPGRYGHLGVSPFEIWIDSLLELRAPSERDCR